MKTILAVCGIVLLAAGLLALSGFLLIFGLNQVFDLHIPYEFMRMVGGGILVGLLTASNQKTK